MPRARRIVPFVAVAVAVTALTVSPATAGGGHDDPGGGGSGRLSAEARADGLDRAGGATMGWRQHGSTPSRSSAARPGAAPATTTGIRGIDVSNYQGPDVDWSSYVAQGKRFAFVKATEGSSYVSPSFSEQYAGAHDAGLVRGAYHFANPAGAGGGTQAQYFVDNGGDWTPDSGTLQGVLDIEYNPYDDGTGDCYGLRHAAMSSWIRAFVNRYKSLTGRNAIIYTTADWWTRCTGNTSEFSARNKLWIARFSSTPGTLPRGWSAYTFWQYATDPVDQDRYPGTLTQLTALANG